MTMLLRLASFGSAVRTLLLASVLLPFLLVQQGSWLHTLGHVANAGHAEHAQHASAMSHSDAGSSAGQASKPTLPAGQGDVCLSCLAFSAGGHAAPCASVPAWQTPPLAMAWLAAVATGQAALAFCPYQSRAPPFNR